ncbi:MAG: hypothetical protein K2X66_11360 [Cyanobacteria bacterium]|nr:hypothetical protein [Cyanobacteriota bacterium]
MSLSAVFKTMAYSLLAQSGINVNAPNILGKKKGTSATGSNGFASFLNPTGLNGTGAFPLNGINGRTTLGQNLIMPTPPTPPANPQDAAAQAQYQQDLLLYNQKFQAYQMQFMRMITSQIQQLQQTNAFNAAKQKTTPSSGISQGVSGTGGILDSVTSDSSV